MQRFASLALVFPVLALTLLASRARAEFPMVLVRSASGPMCQGASSCSHPTDCAAPEMCTTLTSGAGTTSPACLRDTATEIFCCSTVTDCPNFDMTVQCVRSPVTSGGGVGLCLYGDRNYCLVDPTMLGSGELDRFLACHTPAVNPCTDPITPTTLTDFDDGDCDQDGIANIADTHVCMPDSTMCFDAGVPADAGAPDGGNVDAGTADLGSAPMDAGTFVPAPPGVSFRGGAGCTCRITGGGSDPTAALVGSALLVALVVSRRRQSQR